MVSWLDASIAEQTQGPIGGEILIERDVMQIGRDRFFLVEWTDGCLDGLMDG